MPAGALGASGSGYRVLVGAAAGPPGLPGLLAALDPTPSAPSALSAGWAARHPAQAQPLCPPSSASLAGRSLFWERVNTRKCTHTSPRPYHTGSWTPCPSLLPAPEPGASLPSPAPSPRPPVPAERPLPATFMPLHCPVQMRGWGGAEGLQVTPAPPWLPRALRQEPGRSAGPTARVPTAGLCLLLFLGGRPPSSGLGPRRACCLLSRTVEVPPG